MWLTVAPVSAGQPDYVEAESAQVDSADDIKGSLDHGLKTEAYRAPRFRRLSEKLAHLPPFWRDTRLQIKPRLYNFDRQRDDSPDQLTLAASSALSYESGWWRNRIALGVTGYTAQKLRGPADGGGNVMLRPAQNGFGVVGEAYVRIKLPRIAELRLYRQEMNLPYFNKQDIRTVPKTHEAYLAIQNEHSKLEWIAGHVTKMKQSNSDRFIPLVESAGFRDTGAGASLAGFLWKFDDDTNFGIINYQVWDYLNITYTETRTSFDLTEEIPLALSAQATYQASTGKEVAGDIGTYTVGGQASVSYRHGVFSLAGTYTDEDARIRSRFGGKPSYLSIAIADFDRAGEKAWMVGFSYNFGRFGIEGLGFDTKYAQGSAAHGAPDRNEFDFTLDYKPETFWLRGLWFRARFAALEVDDGSGFDDVRLIMNYEVPLL